MNDPKVKLELFKFQLQQVEERLLAEPNNRALILLSCKLKRLLELTNKNYTSSKLKNDELFEKTIEKNSNPPIHFLPQKCNDINILKEMKIGDDCEVFVEVSNREAQPTSIWRHAIIKDISPEYKSASVLLTDIGQISEVSAIDIRPIENFKNLKDKKIYSSKNSHKKLSIPNENLAKGNDDYQKFVSHKFKFGSKKKTDSQAQNQKNWLDFSQKLTKK